MGLIETLTSALGRNPTESDLATHFADSISAQNQLQRISRQEGDVGMLEDSICAIQKLKKQARELGLTREKYPGLFRRY